MDKSQLTVRPPVIKVVGIGGGGGNAVNRMISAGVKGVDFIVANTDLQDIRSSLAPFKLQMGVQCTRGLGAGAKPDVGREAAMEDMDTIREYLRDSDMVFITAGMGGGTGTGAAPVVAELARELGCLTVGVVTKPFKFEGKTRKKNGEEGIAQLRKHVDTLIMIPNDNLLSLANKKTSIIEAFSMADDVLRVAVQGISDLINTDGLINLDFADVRAVLANMGQAIMGTGSGTGENRAVEAAKRAIESPLLDNININGAKGILINVTGSSSMTLHEVYEAATFIENHADDDANIIFGSTIDDSLEDQIEITVIAAGFGENNKVIQLDDSDFRPKSNLRTPPMFAAPPAGGGNLFSTPLGSGSNVSIFPSRTPQTDVGNHGFSDNLGMDNDPPEKEESIFELEDPILEPIETTPQMPLSYRPEEKRGGPRPGGMESDLDIPAFIRRRSARFGDE
ncbi:MAG: cell division protein FtsZ [Deltaproteobacteria bacterium]|nr:cell division protein FtsZ [Deltaproteobacteria bacterium]